MTHQTHQTHRTVRGRSGLTTTRWLLATALVASAGCDAVTTTHESAATVEPTSPQAFVARPRQRLLVAAKPSAPAAEVEAYFKANILPAMIRDRRIGEATVSVGRDGQYIVGLEVRSATAPDVSLAVDVLAAGKSLAEGEKVVQGFAKYFDVRTAVHLKPRPDLSISRSVVGSMEGGVR